MTPTATLKRQLRRLGLARLGWKQRVAAKQQLIRKLRVSVRDLAASRDLWKRRYQSLRQQTRAATPPPSLGVLPLPAAAAGPSLGEA